MPGQSLKIFIKKYSKIENLVRNLINIAPLSIRFGKDFWDWYAFFEVTESWSQEQILEYQLEALKLLLNELVQNSEFYRDRLSGLNINQLDSIDKFRSIVPDLSREEFRNNFNYILSKSANKKAIIKSQTSGTTGMALQFYHLKKDNAREWAAICHQWKRVGYDPVKSRRAEFRGLTQNNKIIDFFPEQNMIRVSILHLKHEYLKYISSEIIKNEVDYYHGYPSAIYLLAKEICDYSINFPQPKAILLASEMVHKWQLSQIQEAFPNTKIFSHYGCAERTVLAGWCEYRQEYHIFPQYSLVEIDEHTYEIIGTNLFNTINGFVRYRMTDAVLESDFDICPDCHRPYTPRLIKLGGRAEDFLYSPENGWIAPAIVTYPLKGLKSIREIQFFQKERNEILIRYTISLSNEFLLKNDLEQIETGLYYLFGKNMILRFEQVDDFARGSSGKFKWIICELDRYI
ncbi:MAG: hypothetical protein A4E53_00653 [Pelotomaculum sp. PtaB.Bin104]|uniref:Phenylacetate--CoA ligase family protein n=1 Tax=Pelotomaculum isophthalicicum JI TaxID=947010 RepID=A0A9X4GXG5_9FIRM|nr:hypothetical protein [Pelotomaculum isophthalicicum]MDF9406785.1 hypothetical protein [Pelotomaculum isophthalicicum JI]OPX91748.1 MAG: hypothetical protein A4E53_00653 [Pelotomaculum sp. PtaB.Bin104]